MADPLTWVAVGSAVLGGLSSIFGGKKADKAARQQALQEARLEQRITDEKLRQLNLEEERAEGRTIATAAASGVEVTRGSPLDILAEQAAEFRYERNTVAEVGASRAANTVARGRMIGQQYRWSSYGQALNQFGSAAQTWINNRPPE